MRPATLASAIERIIAGEPQEKALAGAIAEYLSRQYALPCIPDRPFEPDRYLDRAWHVIR